MIIKQEKVRKEMLRVVSTTHWSCFDCTVLNQKIVFGEHKS